MDSRNVNDICNDILINQISAKVAIINLKSDVCDDEVELNLGDYEIEVRNGKTFAVKKKPKRPTTYEECRKLLHAWIKTDKTVEYQNELLSNFQKLLICRDAYWKTAGEQMGLGKSWEPDWTKSDYKFCIINMKNKIVSDESCYISKFLAFPTEEMRYAFYENFKDLIEKCKELL